MLKIVNSMGYPTPKIKPIPPPLLISLKLSTLTPLYKQRAGGVASYVKNKKGGTPKCCGLALNSSDPLLASYWTLYQRPLHLKGG